MKKVLIAFFIFLFLLLSLFIVKQPSLGSNNSNIPTTQYKLLFNDDFNKGILNTNKWEFFSTNGGTYNFSNGFIVIPGGSTMFYIRTKNNPFPITGSFVVKFGIQYTSVDESGDGVALGYEQQNGYDPNNVPIALWQGSNFGLQVVRYGLTVAVIGKNPDLDYHVVLIKYDGDKYYLYLDNKLKYTSPSDKISKTIWFGNPFCCQSNWTGFKLDYIKVAQLITPTPTFTPTPTITPTSTPSPTPTDTPTPTPPPTPYIIQIADNKPAPATTYFTVPSGYKSMTFHVSGTDNVIVWAPSVSFDGGQTYYEQIRFPCDGTSCLDVTIPILTDLYGFGTGGSSGNITASATLNEEPGAEVLNLGSVVSYPYQSSTFNTDGFSTITITVGGGNNPQQLSIIKLYRDEGGGNFVEVARADCDGGAQCPLTTFPVIGGTYLVYLEGNGTGAVLGAILRP